MFWAILLLLPFEHFGLVSSFYGIETFFFILRFFLVQWCFFLIDKNILTPFLLVFCKTQAPFETK